MDVVDILKVDARTTTWRRSTLGTQDVNLMYIHVQKFMSRVERVVFTTKNIGYINLNFLTHFLIGLFLYTLKTSENSSFSHILI